MPRQYTGEAKCHGCGKSGSESTRLEKESLCYKCEDVLRKGKEYIRLLEEDNCKYSLFRVFRSAFLWNSACFNEVSELLKSLDVGYNKANANKSDNDYYIGSYASGHTTVYLKETVAEKMKLFIDAVKKELEEQLKRGQEEGTSLLVGLNEGSISMSRFEETLEQWNKK